MSRLAELRAKSQETAKTFASDFQKEKEGGGKYEDDRFWKLTVDQAGNGAAEIRFLPGHEDDENAFVKYYDHGFKGPTGKWYIEKSLTSIGQEDPLSQLNSKMWSGLAPFDDPVEWPENKRQQIVRSRKRRLHYVSNILVVNDTANPENNGKVFLYEYGKKIFEKICDVMPTGEPASEFDDPKFNPFDLDTGANFRLIAVKKDGFRNYDKSKFVDQAPAAGTDDELEEILDGLYSLDDLMKPDKFKTYADLSMKLGQVIGQEALMAIDSVESTTAPAQAQTSTQTQPEPEPEPKQTSPDPEPQTSASTDASDSGDDEDEDLLKMFEDMAEENA